MIFKSIYPRVTYIMTLRKEGELIPEPPATGYSMNYEQSSGIRKTAEEIAFLNRSELVGLEVQDSYTGRYIDILKKDCEIQYL